MHTDNLTISQSSRRATIARVAVAAVALLLIGLLITNRSRAAFSATTVNPANAFNAATISLTDDDAGAAMFNVTGMVPGDVATGCIAVTYNGTANPGPVKIYQNAYTETDGAADGASLDSALTFKIDTVNNCTAKTVVLNVTPGSALTAMAAYSNYSNGLSAQWDPPAGTSTVSYLFTATFTPSGSNATDNTRIGDTVSNLIFTWETQAGS